ncbi:MAG: Maf family protein [Planctomycetales bacterium]|nr:Maf family protein [Planctomycetales bacterium]
MAEYCRKSQFILASASPRRQHLLAEAGYCFEVVPSAVDESAFATKGITSEDHTKILALAKAGDVAIRFPNALVIGSDTVVDLEGEIIGKPNDAAHAEEITRKLFSRPHKVITGLALVCIEKNIEIVQADTTIVYPRRLTEAQIAEHIRKGDWQGKAGAYGIQETGDEFVDYIDGSFTNVMGLPMERIKRLLGTLGIHPDKYKSRT